MVLQLLNILNEMASLSIPQLTKLSRYDYRVDNLINKILNKELHELVDGRKVILHRDPKVIHVLRNRDWDAFKQLYDNSFLTSDKTELIRITQLKKTEEYGGEAPDKRLQAETLALNVLDKKIKKLGGRTGITIFINGKRYDNIVQCVKTPGTPKSDFHLNDIEGKTVIWISHKDGTRPQQVQQWSGMTEEEIVSHREVQQFVESVKAMMQKRQLKTFPNKQTWARSIRDIMLKNQAAYGIDYGDWYGTNNVNVIIQGDIDLTPYRDGYKITGPHAFYNGEPLTGEYEPTLMVRYASDRVNFRIQGARFSISSKQARKVSMWI